jgi:anti-sigma B factor antagonist
MNYQHELVNNVLFLKLEGDMLGETDGMELLDIVNNHINQNIVNAAIDLFGVRYMNSTGIGVLITLLTKFKSNNGALVLVNPSEQIQKLLTITKLNSVFTIVGTKEEAIKLF